MAHSFEEYKNFAQKVLVYCSESDMNTIADITTVFKMLLGIPYQMSDNTYVYKFNNYKTFEDLPQDAKNDLSGSLLWSFKPDEFEKLRELLNHSKKEKI